MATAKTEKEEKWRKEIVMVYNVTSFLPSSGGGVALFFVQLQYEVFSVAVLAAVLLMTASLFLPTYITPGNCVYCSVLVLQVHYVTLPSSLIVQSEELFCSYFTFFSDEPQYEHCLHKETWF